MAQRIIVYTTPLCRPCERLKAYLTAHDVDFDVKDLLMDEAAADLLESRNIRSTPALQIGDQIYAGPQLTPQNVDELLGL